MIIGIDCRLSGIRHAGIGRYVYNLIQRLPTLAPDVEWVFWFAEQSQADEVSDAPNVTKLLAPVRHYTVREQWQMPKYFHQRKLDVLHVPHFNIPLLYRGKMVVTIHDLLWHEQRGTSVTTLPSWQYWLKYTAYRFVTTQAIQRAQKIFVPAKTIRDTVLRYYPKVTDKLVITKEGATALVSPNTHSHLAKHTTLLYMGSLYPHKNLKIVLQALELDSELRLIVVGSRSVFQDQLQQQARDLGVEDRITFAGYVPDQKLATYFNKVTALVQPSLSEGFGLTGVEAMAAGVPVVASAIPIFQEIYGKEAAFFEPHEPKSLLRAVAKVSTWDRAKYQHRAQAWIKQYSWDEMAKQTLATYYSLFNHA